jgi:hypothetical protein
VEQSPVVYLFVIMKYTNIKRNEVPETDSSLVLTDEKRFER